MNDRSNFHYLKDIEEYLLNNENLDKCIVLNNENKIDYRELTYNDDLIEYIKKNKSNDKRLNYFVDFYKKIINYIICGNSDEENYNKTFEEITQNKKISLFKSSMGYDYMSVISSKYLKNIKSKIKAIGLDQNKSDELKPIFLIYKDDKLELTNKL